MTADEVPGFPRAITLAGPWRAAVADDELRRTFLDERFDDSAWASIDVPAHWRTNPSFSEADGPLLHRTEFASRDRSADTRTWLVLDGVFYTSDVWLDGGYLGDTEGYFFPHTFEISDACRERDDHVLAMDVACRRETDLAAKRNLTGVFQHWDLLDAHHQPGGIWRPVRVERSGPVRITHFRVLCREATADQARVFVRTVIDTPEARSVEIVTTLAPVDDPSSGGIEQRVIHPLAQGENRVEWTVTVPDPLLWWPHALGDQPRYDLRVAVHLEPGAATGTGIPTVDRPTSAPSDVRTRRIGLRSVTVDDWIFSINGERVFLKGSNQGPVQADLAGATAADFTRDIALARDANLDFLRVHAHVSRPELYEAADAAGMLLWQDMPLQWGYHRSIRKQSRRQARELVDLLGHHPSIFIWCGHNEPMAVDIEPGAWASPSKRLKLMARLVAAQELPTWNKTVLDRAIKRVLEGCDGSRPVVAHSGIFPHLPMLDGTDSHLYFGWYYGHERDLPGVLAAIPRLARFVSEFGAQAVPEDADFLEPERWPDLDWDRALHRHAFQKYYMDQFVPTSDHATFDSWRRATQDYQAELVRRHVETLRRLKYRPAGGFAHFHFADPQPAVSWSVLGHDRAPKLGFGALRDACAPVIVVADRPPASLMPGDELDLAVHVVSDRRIAQTDMIVEAHLHRGEGTESDTTIRRWSWYGEIPPDDCVRVGAIRARVPAEAGPLVVDLVLRGRDDIIAANQYRSHVLPPK